MALKIFSHNQILAQTILSTLINFEKTSLQYPFDKTLLAPVKKFVVSGKMFRGGLFLNTVAGLSKINQPTAQGLSVAAALELAGSAILIQDDIMDSAKLRRDLPALHQQYAQFFYSPLAKSFDLRLGESAAICVSDFLLFLATKILSQLNIKAEVSLKLVETMSLEIIQLIFNQAEELRFAALPLNHPDMTQKKILQIMIGKTARYTVQWPLKFAGILVGVSSQLDQALNEFSLIAGLIFQLSDDRLGLFGKSNLTGKDIDSDAKSGKKTFYAYFASQMLSGNDAKIFGLLYGKTNLKSLELKQLQEILTKAGVVKKVDQLMTDYVIKAKKAIKAFEEFPNLQNLFSETIEFLAIRDH